MKTLMFSLLIILFISCKNEKTVHAPKGYKYIYPLEVFFDFDYSMQNGEKEKKIILFTGISSSGSPGQEWKILNECKLSILNNYDMICLLIDDRTPYKKSTVADTNKKLLEHYFNTNTTPTLLILDSNGKELLKIPDLLIYSSHDIEKYLLEIR